MNRKAFTLVETIVAGALGFTVLAGALGLWRVGDRLNRGASASSALGAMRLVEDTLAVDLRQLSSDPFAADALRVSETALSFRIARFDGDEVRLEPVSWRRVVDAHGIAYLARTAGMPGHTSTRVLSAAPLASARFGLIADAATGSSFVRLDVVPLAADGTADNPDRQTFVVALRAPGAPAIAALAPSLPR